MSSSRARAAAAQKGMCRCRANRSYYGGPCPPCLRKSGASADGIKLMGDVARSLGIAATRKLSYADRNMVLRNMLFKSYQEYLESDLWTGIRTVIFERHGKRCYVCRGPRKARQVHHLYYSIANLTGVSLHGMRPVCSACHLLVEFDRDGNKLDAKSAGKKTAWARRWHGMRRMSNALMRRARQAGLDLDREVDRLIARDTIVLW